MKLKPPKNVIDLVFHQLTTINPFNLYANLAISYLLMVTTIYMQKSRYNCWRRSLPGGIWKVIILSIYTIKLLLFCSCSRVDIDWNCVIKSCYHNLIQHKINWIWFYIFKNVCDTYCYIQYCHHVCTIWAYIVPPPAICRKEFLNEYYLYFYLRNFNLFLFSIHIMTLHRLQVNLFLYLLLFLPLTLYKLLILITSHFYLTLRIFYIRQYTISETITFGIARLSKTLFWIPTKSNWSYWCVSLIYGSSINPLTITLDYSYQGW